jgi:hypothetical protein
MPTELGMVSDARRVADELLELLRLPVTKALDISTPAGFDQAVARLAGRLRQVAAANEAAAMRDALAVLDVNWRQTTPEQRRRLVSEAMVRAGRRTAVIPRQIRAPLGDAAEDVAHATRSALRRRHGLAISAELGAVDHRVIRHVVSSQGNFVRDEYRRRLDSFGEDARHVVAAGLEQGLGNADIAAQLAGAAEAALVKRARFYWDIVASSFAGRGRAFSQLAGFQEAGIERWQYSAVLDEATTPICRFMHGRIFAVGGALDRFDEVDRLSEPEQIKRITPWARERRDPRTGRRLLYVDHARGRVDLAEVIRPGAGVRDDLGSFRARVSDAQLTSLGLLPPTHALCRSTLLPA